MITRRHLIGIGAGLGASLGLVKPTSSSSLVSGTMLGFADRPIENLKIGVIGLGQRGMRSFKIIVEHFKDVDIVAVSDLRESRTAEAARIATEKFGRKPPLQFFGDETMYREALKLDIDLILILTPWLTHAPMAIEAMESGKHVGVEVPLATTMQDLWEIVQTSERTKRHCMMLENVCFGDTEMALRNIVNDGLLGEVVHTECAYIHDLRHYLLDPNQNYPKFWRRDHHKRRNGNLYPTHGLGPVSQYLGIFQSDLMETVSSVSSKSAGLSVHEQENYPVSNTYYCGDMNSSTIKTRNGKSILLQFSTGLPTPYSRKNVVYGTKGVFAGFPDRIALDPDPHNWIAADEILRGYAAPRWQVNGDYARRAGGHGGMDYMMYLSIFDALKAGQPLDIDVYESALWSALGPLSEESVRHGGQPVRIPDFTNGAWENREN